MLSILVEDDTCGTDAPASEEVLRRLDVQQSKTEVMRIAGQLDITLSSHHERCQLLGSENEYEFTRFWDRLGQYLGSLRCDSHCTRT